MTWGSDGAPSNDRWLLSHLRDRSTPRGGLPAKVGLLVSLTLHALVFAGAFNHLGATPHKADLPAREQIVTLLTIRPPEPEPSPIERELPPRSAEASALPAATLPAPKVASEVVPATPREPASMAAPPAPTAAEWAFASTYKLKHSKGYRYTWGQQVRSMMGTAVEGPDQGMVRFRVEIAPDGSLTRLETLWSTSVVAERLARDAIGNMPRWPSTPTGKPLIFEKTIAFSPFASDGPPIYKDDCLPDPPVFRNPFAWNGSAAPVQARAASAPDEPDPQALEDCLKQLPGDSIEAESARDRRLMEQWGWSSGLPRR